MDDLETRGYAVIQQLVTGAQCDELAALYPVEKRFRSRVVMARHGFGQGEYKYFRYPLPGLIARLRTSLYPRLAPIANRWHAAMGLTARFPEKHAQFLKRCHAAGQRRPTPSGATGAATQRVSSTWGPDSHTSVVGVAGRAAV